MQAGLYTIHGSLHTDLSEEAVLDVLTDYDGLSRIYNNIEDSQVLSNGSQKQVLQVGDVLGLHLASGVMASALMLIADQTLRQAQKSIDLAGLSLRDFMCVQTCRWEFLVFSGTFETRLTVHEARQHGEVVFNLISSSFMRHFQGAWKVRIT